MKTISAYKVRINLGEILNEIYYKGEEVIVEKMGKPVAKIVPLKKEDRLINPFLAAAGTWKDVNADKLIKEIYKTRKDASRKKRTLIPS